jgi:hypothetical protein
VGVDIWWDVPLGGSGNPGPGAAPPRWHATATGPAQGVRPLPARPREGSSWRGGGGGSGSGGGGGGGGGKDDLIVVALVVLAIATVSVVALSATEGARYDGQAQIAPGQPVHLENDLGGDRIIPLAGLSRQDLVGVRAARVMDDEGYGLRLLGRGPLDRRGAAFKLDVGALGLDVAGESITGLAANVQVGGFPLQRLGILGTISLGLGEDNLGRSVARHGVALELQTFPLQIGRLHAGPFAHGGVQLVAEPDRPTASGPAFGGGLMIELDLTTRMALYGRADLTAVQLDGQGWRPAGMVTMGMAVY